MTKDRSRMSPAPVLALLLALVALPVDAAVRGRLQVAPDRRHLQYTDGTPFFYLGDTAWSLLHRLNREEAYRYLEDRARKGFTVIQTVAIAEIDGLTEPNPYGALPLTDKDPARPNEAYFDHIDYVIQRAEDLGLFVGLLPTWGRYWKTGPEQIFTPANALAYGRFLGQRYRERAIIWILGGDQNVDTPQERAIIDAMAAGLKEGDGGSHLITFHPRGPGQSSRRLQDATWLDFHMSQTSHAARDHDTGLYAEHDLALTPRRPTLDGEPRYETIPVGFYLRDHDRQQRFDDADVRQAAWWSVLAGACGHTYGDNNIWQMWQPGRAPVINATIPWHEALDHPGARQMGLMRRFLEAHSFEKLIPDQRLIADGPTTGGAKIRAARTQDGTVAIAYSPKGAAFTIDLTKLGDGVRVRESWFDPRYGVTYEIHVGTPQGFQSYTPPTSGRGQDWVLLIEAVRQ
jgi:hypothetical protein